MPGYLIQILLERLKYLKAYGSRMFLRVLKTRKLRVIDASVMAVITNANLNIPTIMIGEKGSFMIRQYWADQFLICSKIERFRNPLEHEKKCFYSRHV